LVDARIYVVGHRNPDTDSICSAIAYAHLKHCLGEPNVRPARAGEINAETAFVLRYFEVPEPELLIDAAGLDLILVDHNEVGQALPHIEQANILEIWEHHRIGDLRPPQPIVVHCEPVGATATLIGELYVARGVTPTRAMAGIMIASILSDTVCFRSPTASEKDHVVASRLQPLAGVDLDAFGKELSEITATALEHKSAAAVVRDDFKEFLIGGLRFGIGQVEVTRPDALTARREDILREMRAVRQTQGLVQVILMVTDVSAEATDLWVVGDRLDVLEKAFGPVERHAVHAPGCMSRKKQVVPRLETVLARGDAVPGPGG
jgi:manganese-dependent inorganic pyrophosphatase